MPLVATRLVSVTVTNFFQKFGSYSQFPGGGMSVLPPPLWTPMDVHTGTTNQQLYLVITVIQER